MIAAAFHPRPVIGCVEESPRGAGVLCPAGNKKCAGKSDLRGRSCTERDEPSALVIRGNAGYVTNRADYC